MLSARLYESLLQDIEAEFEARKRNLENDRRKAIEALNEAWPKMGGSEEDLKLLEMEAAIPSPVEEPPAEETTADEPRETAPARNGDSSEAGRTINMAIIREEVRKALLDTDTDIITQTDLKDRILKKYPDAKIASVAPSISRCLSQMTDRGELELVERGTASKPHKYRKTRRAAEVGLLEP